jgi:hypothetical protein
MMQAVNGKGKPETVPKLDQIKESLIQKGLNIVIMHLMVILVTTDCTGNLKTSGDANPANSLIPADS